eukprot:1999226-Pyramimonas_sp.AAC.1
MVVYVETEVEEVVRVIVVAGIVVVIVTVVDIQIESRSGGSRSGGRTSITVVVEWVGRGEAVAVVVE